MNALLKRTCNINKDVYNIAEKWNSVHINVMFLWS
jgi:hypothetical protein